MNKLLITIILFLLFSNSILYSQETISIIQYASYYGGIETDDADVVAVDVAGNIYMGCHSNSKKLPGATKYPYTLSGGMDAFIIKLTKNGDEVAYITKLGGSKWDAVQGITTDALGNVYVVGTTYSANFPVDSNGFQSNFGGKSDAFVAKINLKGKVIWSTFLGGNKDEDGRDIALDKDGNIYIIGRTKSKNFPVSVNALQSKWNGGIDAFITKLNPNGKVLTSTYLGGSGDDIGFSIKHNSKQLYIAGTTNSVDFPVKNAIQSQNKGGNDVFLTQLDATASAIHFSTYIGGTSMDQLYNVDLDASGNVFIMGVTNSINYPTTSNALQSNFKGDRDIFISNINIKKKQFIYSTYIGGSKVDNPRNLVVDNNGNAIIVGYTASADFPNTTQKNIQGSDDAFITKLDVSGSFLHKTYIIGGNDKDVFEGLALGIDGSIIVSGASSSSNFPIQDALQKTFLGGRFDMIVARLFIP